MSALPPTPDEWRRLEPLIDAVLDAAPSERDALLERLSGGDAERRAELERLVAECERAFPLLDQPASEHFASVLGAEMPMLPRRIAGRYEVVREVGRGGMAIVYLARDLRHGRDVAIKVVHPALGATMGRERFLREIEIAARLRHPLIVPLYDSGEVPREVSRTKLLYYVMPYETGHSLRERLERSGPLPVADVLLVLRDLCEALSHAHAHGVVHRDIKPDNVLLSGGHALVTDFGVARAVTEATQPFGVMTLGTPTYMAPEAMRDGPVDHRADLYAVGVLAYELLAARVPFAIDMRRSFRDLRTPEKRVDDEMAALARDRADLPPALAQVIARCLARNPDHRWQSADDLLAELSSIGGGPVILQGGAPRRSTRVALAGAGVVLVGTIVVLGRPSVRSRDALAPIIVGRATPLTAERGLEVQPAFSPDGRQVAYAVGHSLRMRITVKPIVGGRARWLTADSTANQWFPRWSPDGARILFLSGGGVFSASASGDGAVREEVASRPAAIVRSAAWSPDGRTIAYVRGDSLLARHAGTDDARLVTTAPDLHSCDWSPDGAWIACVSGNSFHVTPGAVSGVGPMFANLAPSRIVVVPSAGGMAAIVTDSVSLNQSPVWSRDGRTLYYISNRQGPRDVYALDVHDLRSPARSRAARQPARITTGIGAQSIDLARDGSHLVYAAYASTANVWSMPIPGRSADVPASASPSRATPVTSGNQTVEGVRVSPDGRWLVYDSDLSGNSAIYRVPIAGGEPERLTRGPADAFRGTIAPDGRELAYHSFQTGSRNLFVASLDGAAPRRLTHTTGQYAMANWSPDGDALAFFDMLGTRVMVIRRYARGVWGEPRFTGARGWRAEWSPDGRTIAYVSPTDGRIGIVAADSGAPRDVYVPDEGGPVAELALFAADGRALYFKSHDALGRASFWSVPVTGGRPRMLVRFDDPVWTSNRFDFASDGRSFYFTVEDRQSDLWVAEISAITRGR